ncbi:hypothetical protein E1193_30755 [Micromonospora sp. KC606]|uniref:hypothetical protein n=1 Tax=Micromonospora sp. KC606 TaxID=2530379 RepID=UPI001046D6D1|nr:hypothetical protein [Micromonospora sp. KC606]TDC69127.1 hypothetical protein E1193_30755 [Micromonospora sp. KC606]
MSPRLIRGLLALYPRLVRERYGDEIADLLTHSSRPVRDLADVAWCALTDRREHFTVHRPCIAKSTMVKLLAAPAIFGMALLIALSAVLMVFNNIDNARTGYQSIAIASAATVLPVALLAVRWGRSIGRRGAIAAPGLVVPAALATVVTALWVLPSIPLSGESLGASLVATLPATVTWCVGMSVLITVTARLRGRGVLSAVVTVAGGYLVLELSTIANVLSVLDAQAAPRQDALLWYPATITGYDPGLVMGTNDMLHDAVGILPAVLTICTVFALAIVTNAATDETPEPVVALA